MTNEYPNIYMPLPDLHFSFVFFVRSSNVLSFERLIEPNKFPFCPSDNVSDTTDFAIVAPLSNALVSETSISFGACIHVEMLMRGFVEICPVYQPVCFGKHGIFLLQPSTHISPRVDMTYDMKNGI